MARLGIAGATKFEVKELLMSMNEARKVLTQMARQHGGVLTVDDVLTEAVAEESPLHQYFEWNDDKAADAYRRQQARALIQRCRIRLVQSEPEKIRAFVSLPSDREAGGGYRLTTQVLGDDRMREELLRDIQLTVVRWQRKLHLLDADLADKLAALEETVTRRSQRGRQQSAGKSG